MNMEHDLLEIKEKILDFCKKYKVRDVTIYLEQVERYTSEGYYDLITKDVNLEIKV